MSRPWTSISSASKALLALVVAVPLALWIWLPNQPAWIVGAAFSSSLILGELGMRLLLDEREPLQPRRAIGWSAVAIALLIWVVPILGWIVLMAVVGDGTIGAHM